MFVQQKNRIMKKLSIFLSLFGWPLFIFGQITSISGPASLCQLTNGQFSLTGNFSGADSIKWTLSSSGQINNQPAPKTIVLGTGTSVLASFTFPTGSSLFYYKEICATIIGGPNEGQKLCKQVEIFPIAASLGTLIIYESALPYSWPYDDNQVADSVGFHIFNTVIGMDDCDININQIIWCKASPKASGIVYNDLNLNGVFDGDDNYAFGKLKILKGSGWSAYINVYGTYSIFMDDGYRIACEPEFANLTVSPVFKNYTASIPTGYDFAVSGGPIVHGRVVKDLNGNCQADAGDLTISDAILSLNSNPIRYRSSDSDGNYYLNLPNFDSLKVHIDIPNNSFLTACQNDIWVKANAANDVIYVDFVLTGPDCGLLNAELSDNGLFRQCTNSTIFARICNHGTAEIDNPTATVTLDDDLVFVNSSIIPSQILGQKLFFELPPLAPGECSNFNITVKTKCGTPFGTPICSELRAAPDTICVPPAGWLGDELIVTSACVGDSIAEFTITNIGFSPMIDPRKYIIIEDVLTVKTGNVQLNAGESLNLNLSLKSDFAQILVQQVENFPFSSEIRANLYNCGSAMPPSKAATMLPTGDQEPYLDIDCALVRGSYDPNDKLALPEGYQTQHLIRGDDRIEYTIRFQNTGNDTAFLVRILDKLPAQLDPASIRVSGASHPFSWNFVNDNTVEFLFSPIKLIDKNTNEPASQGFVQFSILLSPRTHVFTQLAIIFHPKFSENRRHPSI
jgi:uncharacterized repeat protein (TIGR01451 family)